MCHLRHAGVWGQTHYVTPASPAGHTSGSERDPALKTPYDPHRFLCCSWPATCLRSDWGPLSAPPYTQCSSSARHPGAAAAHSGGAQNPGLAALVENWSGLESPHPTLCWTPHPPDLPLAETRDHTSSSLRVSLQLPGNQAPRRLSRSAPAPALGTEKFMFTGQRKGARSLWLSCDFQERILNVSS